MKSAIRYAAAAVVLAGCICTSALLTGCKERGGKEALSPEATVEAFTRHIAAGEFGQAMTLCDTVRMRDYIQKWTQLWNTLEKKDSSTLAIASGLLAGAEFNFESSEKTDNGREVCYNIEAGGQSVRRKAMLRKEEGEWMVETITDAI